MNLLDKACIGYFENMKRVSSEVELERYWVKGMFIANHKAIPFNNLILFKEKLNIFGVKFAAAIISRNLIRILLFHLEMLFHRNIFYAIIVKRGIIRRIKLFNLLNDLRSAKIKMKKKVINYLAILIDNSLIHRIKTIKQLFS